MTQTSDFNFQEGLTPSFPRRLFPKDFKPALSGTDANIIIGDEVMNICPNCGGEKECLAGHSAHPDNWYCPNCEYPNEEQKIDQHEPGAKLDQGKPRVGLVLGGFSKALLEVAKVGTFGANKYTDDGWKQVENGLNRYTDAMYRHLMAEAGGEHVDPESELPHAAHAAWNALARLSFLLLSPPVMDPKQEYLDGPGGYRFNPNDIVGGGS